MTDSLSKELTTIVETSASEARVIQSVLEGRGLFVHLANQTIKTVDPLITGVGMFDLAVQVPRDQAAEALEILMEIREQRSSREPERPVVEDPTSALERLGRRLRWGAVLALFSPFFPLLGWMVIAGYTIGYAIYIARVRKSAARPAYHALTLASVLLVLCALALVVVVTF
jgi:hypothetical protein